MEVNKLVELIDFIVDTYVYGKEKGSVSVFQRKKKVVLTPQHLRALIEAVEGFLNHLKIAVEIPDKDTREYIAFRLFEAYDALARAVKKIERTKMKMGEPSDVIGYLSHRIVQEEPAGDTEKEDKE